MVNEQECKIKIARFLKCPVERLEDDGVLLDLVSESFQLVEMIIELQDELKVRLIQEDLRLVRTVRDLTQILISKSS